jgi:hypothetical protein
MVQSVDIGFMIYVSRCDRTLDIKKEHFLIFFI